ncbi:MAG: DNA adenine methylase [Actinobacteria bacterium]|nr:DNA adenine methylase [Actinomycetota bacterium]
MPFKKYCCGDDIIRPPLKWAGGKSQLIEQFKPLFPHRVDSLIEPFVGGGAVFFHLKPRRAILIDTNMDLINFYRVVRNDLKELLSKATTHINSEEYYYSLRALNTNLLDNIERASRFIYLNKTAFNGLWRVNSKGKHNAPFGYYKNPKIVDEYNLLKVRKLLEKAEIIHGDFSLVLGLAQPNNFIYMDPPYHPLSETAHFTSYTAKSFNVADQKRLADVYTELDQRGCRVMLSNSDTPLILELYKNYNIKRVTARRAINCRAEGRGPISELVIRNYS